MEQKTLHRTQSMSHSALLQQQIRRESLRTRESRWFRKLGAWWRSCKPLRSQQHLGWTVVALPRRLEDGSTYGSPEDHLFPTPRRSFLGRMVVSMGHSCLSRITAVILLAIQAVNQSLPVGLASLNSQFSVPWKTRGSAKYRKHRQCYEVDAEQHL
jgi:hypothetical protein